MDTLPTSSASRRPSTWRAVSLVPSWPASGEVLMPIVMDRLGSSTVMAGSATGVVRVGERLADRDLGEAGDGADLARPGLGRVDPVERLGDVELGDAHLLDRSLELAPRDRLTLGDRAVLHAAQREPAEVGRCVEVRHERLQRVTFFVGRRGDVVEQELEERLEVAALRVGIE